MVDAPKPAPAPVLFFVRGRGSGHAHAALAVARTLGASGSALPLRFVSCAAGAETLREAGHDVIDLGLSERNTFVETVAPVGEVIRDCGARLVVAHEEFAVPAAARILGVPSVFLTDWFSDAAHSNMNALRDATEILFLDQAGIFDEPEYLNGKVRYVGPILRERQYGPGDRARARRELGLGDGDFVVVVFVHPGRRDETIAPTCDLLLRALDLLGVSSRILWLTAADPVLSRCLEGRQTAKVLGPAEPFDRLMAACDLAFTKGNRNIVLELASFGVPTISLSHRLNRIDDIRTSRVKGNATLAAARLTPEILANRIREMMEKRAALAAQPAFQDGARGVAARLIELAAGNS